MPTLNINKQQLFKALGHTYSDDEFRDLCFDFGLELDEIVSEKVPSKNPSSKQEVEEIIYKIDIPANRYDLLCIEGLSKALLIFQKKLIAPEYKRILKENDCITVHNNSKNTQQIRPFIVAAVLRNVTLNQEGYDSFIDFQDKLHHNICRKRTLVAIGTHDLDTIKPPIYYDAKPPSEIKFRALNQKNEHSAVELMDIYANHAQLKQYVPIIKDSPVYPVVLDSEGVVLSLPPIINGDHSKISVDTKNIFIECTATDLTKAIIVLDTLVCAFSTYCKEPFTVEGCKVTSTRGTEWFPHLKYRKETLSVKKINGYLGVKSTESEIVEMLNKMSLNAQSAEGQSVEVRVPPSRHDIIHPCDIIEDVAISIGYNNIPKVVPSTSTVSNQFSLNKLTEQLRYHVAFNGFSEALTFSLCSRNDISSKLRKDLDQIPAVHVSNPKTLEFQVARTTLIPGLLKTVSSNKQLPLPIRVFEISDVVFKIKSGVGARNERHLCAVYYSKTSGFEIIHGLLDKIMQYLEVPRDAEKGYTIRSAEDSTFFPERCADILYKGEKIGVMGILHPEVVTEFVLALPCSCLEFNIEPFV
ncbi:phenylalanine--tRNA ligase beta subunit [Planococcus citri]|uniref:phenylalanine--tRNA ligase beta subunit n=1 Tax=Planococcus citri TaxID=170843 RepID=UPI0031F87E88